jgi:hypothetical protein
MHVDAKERGTLYTGASVLGSVRAANSLALSPCGLLISAFDDVVAHGDATLLHDR